MSHFDDSDLYRHLTASMRSFSDTYDLLDESLSLAASQPNPLKPADIRDYNKAITVFLKAIARRLDANQAILH